ncbi:MAG: hypothetical protein QOF72_1450 [Blastocatellia bacterium]|nr:hypothetical protein [Blastocatellia bacterium]
MLIHYQLVHLISFVIAKRGKVSAPKAKSRSNWGFRFRRMTGKPAEAGTRPSPWSLHNCLIVILARCRHSLSKGFYAASGPSAVGPVSDERS